MLIVLQALGALAGGVILVMLAAVVAKNVGQRMLEKRGYCLGCYARKATHTMGPAGVKPCGICDECIARHLPGPIAEFSRERGTLRRIDHA